MAGADSTKLPTVLERRRMASIGLFVVLIGLLAAGALSLYVTVIAGGFSPWVLIPALFWGFLVFWIDRSILIEPSYGKLDAVERRVDTNLASRAPAVGSPWPPVPAPDHQPPTIPPYRPASGVAGGMMKWLLYGSRLGIALAIAFLISEVLVLLIFRPEIIQETTGAANATYLVAIQGLAAEESAALQPRITALQEEIDTSAGTVTDAKQQMQEARDNYDLEASGKGGTGDRGDGPRTRAEWDNYQNAQRKYDETVGQHEATVAGHNRAIQELLQRQADLATPTSTAFTALETSPRGQDLHDQIHAAPGWLAQERAFRRFQQQSGDWATAVVPWVIRGLLVMIDLLPLSLKLLNGYTLYGRGIRDEAQLIRHRDRRWLISELRRIDHRAEFDDYVDDLTLRLHHDNHSTYHRIRADHLRRPE